MFARVKTALVLRVGKRVERIFGIGDRRCRRGLALFFVGVRLQRDLALQAHVRFVFAHRDYVFAALYAKQPFGKMKGAERALVERQKHFFHAVLFKVHFGKASQHALARLFVFGRFGLHV